MTRAGSRAAMPAPEPDEREAERALVNMQEQRRGGGGRNQPPPPAPPPAPPPRQRARLSSEGDDGGGDDDGGSERARAEDVENRDPTVLLWRLKGKLAGRAASDAARAQRPYSADVPADVAAAGPAAELEYLVAFEENFQTPALHTGELVSGLVVKKKRRRTTGAEVNMSGLAGLKANAGPHMSAAVYALVRTDFFSPADHARATVHAGLKQQGFQFTEAEFGLHLKRRWRADAATPAFGGASRCRRALMSAAGARGVTERWRGRARAARARAALRASTRVGCQNTMLVVKSTPLTR